MLATFFTFLAGFVLGALGVTVLSEMDAERRRAAVRKAGE